MRGMLVSTRLDDMLAVYSQKPARPAKYLTRQQTLLVRELALTPGRFVPTAILEVALGFDTPELATAARFRVHATVEAIRHKFGAAAVESRRGHAGGYRLPIRSELRARIDERPAAPTKSEGEE